MMADRLPFFLLCTSAGNPPPQPRLPPCSTLCSLLCAHPPVEGLSQVRVLSHLPPPLHQKFQEVLDCLLEPRGQPQSLALNPGRGRPSPVCCMNSCLGWLLKGREEMNTVLFLILIRKSSIFVGTLHVPGTAASSLDELFNFQNSELGSLNPAYG